MPRTTQADRKQPSSDRATSKKATSKKATNGQAAPAASPAATGESFDPNAAAQPGSGIFGLTHKRRDSRVVVFPAAFDATTSYGKGTAAGPGAILTASAQVDLFDLRFGRIYERGICMLDEDRRIRALNRRATALTGPIIAKGGAGPRDGARMKKIDAICEEANGIIHAVAASILSEDKIPALLGGEHAMSFGAIRACAEKHGEIGILQIDAHMDLRDAFEGFAWSHASIMHNVISRLPAVTKLVQIGIRDFGEGEMEFARQHQTRITTCFDEKWADEIDDGARFAELVRRALSGLPKKVYVSFDIDGLDPSMCPHTGTPVAGGLSFARAARILELLKSSGRTIVGFDLVEVAPGPAKGPEIDANVGARVLYKLCGLCD